MPVLEPKKSSGIEFEVKNECDIDKRLRAAVVWQDFNASNLPAMTIGTRR